MAEEVKKVQKGIKIIFPTVEEKKRRKNISSSTDKSEEQLSAKITFDSYTSDFESVVQNALTDTLTVKGSDKMYPDRGTDIHKRMLEGSITDTEEMIHTANFGALDVTTFINDRILEQLEIDNTLFSDAVFNANTTSYIYQNIPESLIGNYQLIPVDITDTGVVLNAIFTSSKDEVIGSETVVEF